MCFIYVPNITWRCLFPPLVSVSHLVLPCVPLPPAWALTWIHLRGKYCGLTQENVSADICCRSHNKTHHRPNASSDAPTLARAEGDVLHVYQHEWAQMPTWDKCLSLDWTNPGADLKEAHVVNVALVRKKVPGWFILMSSSRDLDPKIENKPKNYR